MSRRKRALLTTISALILQLVLLIVNLILPRFIIIQFGSGVNGLINSLTQFLSYIILLETGIGGVVSSLLYKSLVKNDNNDLSKIIVSTQKFFRKLCIYFLIYILILCFIYPILVNNQFDTIYTILLLLIIAISSFVQYYFGLVNQILIKSDQRGYIVNISKIISYIVSTIAMIIFIKIGFGIHLVKLIGTIILSLSPISYYLYVRKKYNINYSVKENSKILSQRWDGFAHQISSFIHTNTDIVILTIFSTMSEVSVYSIYNLITTGLKSFITIFSNSLSATFGNMLAKKEIDNLKKQFLISDYFNLLIVIFVFTIAGLLITPFVNIYVEGVSDANYYRPVFGYILVISEAIYCIRCSYTNLIYIFGDFKQTKHHAYIESLLNIIISLILIKPFGIIGIIIGTLIGMTSRLILSIIYVKKNIINFDIYQLIKKYLINIIASIIIVFISINLSLIEPLSYIDWIINALIYSTIGVIVIILFNYIFFKKEMKEIKAEYFDKIKKGYYEKNQ